MHCAIFASTGDCDKDIEMLSCMYFVSFPRMSSVGDSNGFQGGFQGDPGGFQVTFGGSQVFGREKHIEIVVYGV